LFFEAEKSKNRLELAFQKKIKLWVSMRGKDFNIFDFGLLLKETVAVKKYES